jgi:hypothetical protein
MNFPQPKAAAGVSKDMSYRAGMKPIYLKRWRTIIYVSEGYADEIRDTMNATTLPSSDQCVAREALEWPSREVIAREIRLAMLDNPTDEAFNKRAEKREAIANDAADIILARFALTVPQAAVADTMTDQRLLEDMTLADNARRVAIEECASIALAIDSGRGNEKEIAKAILALTNPGK